MNVQVEVGPVHYEVVFKRPVIHQRDHGGLACSDFNFVRAVTEVVCMH